MLDQKGIGLLTSSHTPMDTCTAGCLLTHCFSFCTFLLIIIRMLHFDVSLQVAFPFDGHATHGTRHPQVGSRVLQHVLCQHLSPGEGARAQMAHIWPEVCQMVTLQNGSLGKALVAYWTDKRPSITCR